MSYVFFDIFILSDCKVCFRDNSGIVAIAIKYDKISTLDKRG